MNLLSLDTSTDHLALAVTEDGKTIGRFNKNVGRNHSTLLIPMIGRLLKNRRLKLKEIDAFCIGIGPGSFTGLRIGVATVKGLAFSLNKPIVTVPTLDAIADNMKKFKGVICAVLDARKNKVYASFYKSDGKNIKKISKYLLLSVNELMEKAAKYEKIVFLGDAVEKNLLNIPNEKQFKWHPKAETLGRIGTEYYKKKKFTKPEDLKPLYLYSKECDVAGR